MNRMATTHVSPPWGKSNYDAETRRGEIGRILQGNDEAMVAFKMSAGVLALSRGCPTEPQFLDLSDKQTDGIHQKDRAGDSINRLGVVGEPPASSDAGENFCQRGKPSDGDHDEEGDDR
jgi:hypothetical protein